MESKQRFKTNNVNSIFMRTVQDSTDASSPTPGVSASDNSSPAPTQVSGSSTVTAGSGASGTAAAGANSKGKALATSTGNYKLGAIQHSSKETGTRWGDLTNAPGAAAASNSAAAISTAAKTTASQSAKTGSVSAEKSSFDMDEAELAKKGIFVANRYASTTDVNWSDEEDDWQPPSASSLGLGAKAAPSEDSSRTEQPGPATHGAWTRPTVPPTAAKSVSDQIQALRQQSSVNSSSGGSSLRPKAHGGLGGGPSLFGNSGARDGMSRFRLDRVEAPPSSFSGPGSRRGLGSRPGGFDNDNEVLDWTDRRGPLAVPEGPPTLEHRKIPDRFKIKSAVHEEVPESDATAAAAAQAPLRPEFEAKEGAGKNPFGAAKPAVAKPSVESVPPPPPPGPEMSAEEIKAQQQKMMKQALAEARARHEAEEKEELERRARLAARHREEAERIREARESERRERQARLEQSQAAQRTRLEAKQAANASMRNSLSKEPKESEEGMKTSKRNGREAQSSPLEQTDWRKLKAEAGGHEAALAEARERRRAERAERFGRDDRAFSTVAAEPYSSGSTDTITHVRVSLPNVTVNPEFILPVPARMSSSVFSRYADTLGRTDSSRLPTVSLPSSEPRVFDDESEEAIAKFTSASSAKSAADFVFTSRIPRANLFRELPPATNPPVVTRIRLPGTKPLVLKPTRQRWN